MEAATAKKPSEIDKINTAPESQQGQVVSAAGAHHGKKTPEGKSRKAEPEGHPVQGKKAEEAQGGGGNKATNLGGVDGVEVKILDLRSNQSALP